MKVRRNLIIEKLVMTILDAFFRVGVSIFSKVYGGEGINIRPGGVAVLAE